jgi:pimeloyl-ACP methyl ester carboxylesterase
MPTAEPLAPDRFTVERVAVGGDQELAFVRAGAGGAPLLLLHGWPETKRIWWRNVEPLAAAGFEVIAPDLRGFGDSSVAADGFYDPAAHARDMHALLHDALGHECCMAAGGDVGGVVVQDLGLRFPGFVERQCIFNTVLPVLPDDYERAGIPRGVPREMRAVADYFRRQGREADELAAELDTPERRRRYIAQFYGSRLWAAPGSFDEDATAFMTEPFADGEKLRASFGVYEVAMGSRPASEPPRLFERNPVPTLVLYGPEDHVIPPDFPERCEVAFTERVGPFLVPRAGHFLQWERPDVLNQALIYFFADPVARRTGCRS